MIIKVDVREQELLTKIKQLVLFIPIFKKLQIITENLPIGDIIISDDNNEEKLKAKMSDNLRFGTFD